MIQNQDTCAIDDLAESGSAVLEFIMIALPLIASALIFFISMHHSGLSQSQGSALAREAVHAFVEAESDAQGYLVVTRLLTAYESSSRMMLDVKSDEITGNRIITHPAQLSFSVHCSRSPCISPSTSVEITIFSDNSQGKVQAIGKARSSVSRWIP